MLNFRGVFTYMDAIEIYKNQPHVGKYAIHGWYGLGIFTPIPFFQLYHWVFVETSQAKKMMDRFLLHGNFWWIFLL